MEDGYIAAWKALRASLMTKEVWTTKELCDLLAYLELEYRVGCLGHLAELSHPLYREERSKESERLQAS